MDHTAFGGIHQAKRSHNACFIRQSNLCRNLWWNRQKRAVPPYRNIPGSIECQRGETVRGAALRVLRIGVGRAGTAGAALTLSFSCTVLACVPTRVFGHTAGSSPLLLAAAKVGLAISNNKKTKTEEFIGIAP